MVSAWHEHEKWVERPARTLRSESERANEWSLQERSANCCECDEIYMSYN